MATKAKTPGTWGSFELKALQSGSFVQAAEQDTDVFVRPTCWEREG